MSTKKILFLYAFPEEAQHLFSKLPQLERKNYLQFTYHQSTHFDTEMMFVCTGIGTSHATMLTTVFCQFFQPDLIIVFGTAGGLNAGQQTGDIVIADRIIDLDLYHLPHFLNDTPFASCLKNPHNGRTFTSIFDVTPNWLDQLPLTLGTVGTVVTSNVFPLPKSELNTISKLGALAIEMEASAVCRVATAFSIPYLVIRAISNSIDNQGIDQGSDDKAIATCSQALSHFLLETAEMVTADCLE